MTMKAKTTSLFFIILSGLLLGAACSAGGPKIELDPESQEFYQSARLIMTSQENKIFKRLTDAESRREFIEDFWAKRDPEPETEINEFQKEFESRVEYANRRFREGGPGMNSDRGRIYIYMGPPDKFEEYLTHSDPSIRGPIIWWIYYNYELLIEFVDEKGINQFKIRNYDGDFFGAIDVLKLGHFVRSDDVFRKKIVNFQLTYDSDVQELEVSIPAKTLIFKENDEGKFQVDLNFTFYVYKDEGVDKETFTAGKSFIATNAELLELKDAVFAFPQELAPGTHFVDVIIEGPEGTYSKVRKIFEIKVKR